MWKMTTQRSLLHEIHPSIHPPIHPSIHTTKSVLNTFEALNWKLRAHAARSPKSSPFDYHLFASIGYTVDEQHFASHEYAQESLGDWFASKERQPQSNLATNVCLGHGQILNKRIFLHFHRTNVCFLYKNSAFIDTYRVWYMMYSVIALHSYNT